MISNSKTKGAVKIARETASSWSCENMYHVNNVNVAQGPRTGNRNLDMSKRTDFIASKEAREPMATIIQDAYAKRQHEYADYEYTNGGSIHDNTKEPFYRQQGLKRTAGRRK